MSQTWRPALPKSLRKEVVEFLSLRYPDKIKLGIQSFVEQAIRDKLRSEKW